MGGVRVFGVWCCVVLRGETEIFGSGVKMPGKGGREEQ
jgi:hypothetical protein